jgi:uncharacterized protein (TIGR00162 family)
LARKKITVLEQEGIEFKEFSRPKTNNAVLVCGLPGSGYVGKLGADHLTSLFHGEKMAEYYCDSFPPQVNVKEEGKVQPIRGELYYARTGAKNDLLIFSADAQPTTPEGEYALSDVVLGHAKRAGVKVVYTLAAYITGGFSKSPKVYGASTSPVLLDRLAKNDVHLMKGGGITGMNGILIGLATIHGMEGICLLGDTSGYLIDAGASQSVLETLSRLLEIKFDLSSLKQKAEETQQVISQLQRMSEQPRETQTPGKAPQQPGYIS